jgi:ABC-type bacteriocin/lantibiotic exporter with double-glycine peptidase domain
MQKLLRFAPFWVWLVLLYEGAVGAPRGAPTALERRTCGDVCVEVLCDFYGLPFDLDRARTLLRVDDSGDCSLADLQHTIEELGLTAHVVQGDVESVLQIEVPIVRHIRQPGAVVGNHFCVAIPDAKAGALMAIEPFAANRPIPITHDMLERSWTGVALIVKRPEQSISGLALTTVFFGGVFLGGLIAILLPRKAQAGTRHCSSAIAKAIGCP